MENIIIGFEEFPLKSDIIEVPAHGFENRLDIEHVEIPHGVKTIGNFAFSGCVNLKSVVIPDSVKTIGNAAFKYCKNLQSISLASVDSIGISAFAFCESLPLVEFSHKLQKIGNRAFYQCKSIKKICIPGCVEDLGNSIFCGCEALADLTLSDGVPLIGADMFKNCIALKEVTIPRTARWVGDSPFAGCVNIEYLIFAPKSKDCYVNPYRGLKNIIVRIPKECVFISNPYSMAVLSPSKIELDEQNKMYETDNDALYCKKDKSLFYYYGSESKFVVKDGTLIVGKYAFYGKKCLEEVYLPNSIVSIEEKAFGNCKNLKIFVPSKDVYEILVKAKVNCETIVNK